MKRKHLLSTIIFCFAFAWASSVQAQTPKTVCQIVQAPINGDQVVTQGHVQSIIGDDDFMLSSGGCTIKCDGQSSNMPTVGMSIAVQGRVEIEDGFAGGDELEIDVTHWVPEGGTIPPPPTGDGVTTVAAALEASPGTGAFLTGEVTSWTDENDGEGIFTDNTGSIAIDFEEGNKPTIGQAIDVLGTVDTEDGGKEIDVYFWIPEGTTPPPAPAEIAWTVEEANAAPVGTYAIIPGAVVTWTNETDGEGNYSDLTGSIVIDFEDGVPLPPLLQPIYVVGQVGTDNSVKEIEAYGWDLFTTVGINELSKKAVQIYPNPTSDKLNIEIDGEFTNIRMMDVTGRIVLNINTVQNTTINVSDYTKGIYFVSILNNDKVIAVQKILIE